MGHRGSTEKVTHITAKRERSKARGGLAKYYGVVDLTKTDFGNLNWSKSIPESQN